MKKALIVGISSDIGIALYRRLEACGYMVDGTYNETMPGAIHGSQGVGLLHPLDCSSPEMIEEWMLTVDFPSYDAVIFLQGTMLPLGNLEEVDYTDWLRCHQVNFLSVVQILNCAIKSLKKGCKVLTVAGGGVNGSPQKYNSYISSKVSLVKFSEILASEFEDYIFINFGPGWIDTRIHRETIAYKNIVPKAFQETERRYRENDFIPMERLIDSIFHLIELSNKHYSGRNFSIANGEIFSEGIDERLATEYNLFKLRRFEGPL